MRPKQICAVVDGQECIMPDQRKWSVDKSVNIPTVIAIIGMLAGFGSWMVTQERRMTTIEQNEKYLDAVDKSVKDQIQANEALAARDRNEMRDDIKEVKVMVVKLVERGR